MKQIFINTEGKDFGDLVIELCRKVSSYQNTLENEYNKDLLGIKLNPIWQKRFYKNRHLFSDVVTRLELETYKSLSTFYGCYLFSDVSLLYNQFIAICIVNGDTNNIEPILVQTGGSLQAVRNNRIIEEEKTDLDQKLKQLPNDIIQLLMGHIKLTHNI